MSERNWQDIMIEILGPAWVKLEDSYTIEEIGRTAEFAANLERQNKILKEALTFYADGNFYDNERDSPYYDDCEEVQGDLLTVRDGKRARQALGEIK